VFVLFPWCWIWRPFTCSSKWSVAQYNNTSAIPWRHFQDHVEAHFMIWTKMSQQSTVDKHRAQKRPVVQHIYPISRSCACNQQIPFWNWICEFGKLQRIHSLKGVTDCILFFYFYFFFSLSLSLHSQFHAHQFHAASVETGTSPNMDWEQKIKYNHTVRIQRPRLSGWHLAHIYICKERLYI